MFERYTESAKRVIFFGRYEASQHGSFEIGTEHLLLGVFRGDRRLARRVLGSGGMIHRYRSSHAAVNSIRGKVASVGGTLSTSVDIPLSKDSIRVLKYAAEEADRLGDRHIRSEHVLFGLLREADAVAAKLLNAEGITLQLAIDKVGVQLSHS